MPAIPEPALPDDGAAPLPIGGDTAVFVMRGEVALRDVPRLCQHARRLLDVARPRWLVCDVSGVDDAALGTVAAVTRVTLVARQRGCRVRLRGASPRLREVLGFLGLSEAVPCEEDGPCFEIEPEATG